MKKMLLSLGVLLVGGVVFASQQESPVPLIPRAILFSDPEKTCLHISPDGTKLAYLAPADGVLNIWVKTLGKEDDRPVTHEKKRGIGGFSWAYNNKMLIYARDTDGDENWHLWRVSLETGLVDDLTPFSGVQAGVCVKSKHFPDEILITMNREEKKRFDVYRLNLVMGKSSLVERNPGAVARWIADAHLSIRAAMCSNPDGSVTLLIRDNEKSEWEKKGAWNLEEATNMSPYGFSQSGAFFYFMDAVGVDTKRLIKMNCKTGEKEIVVADEHWDVGRVFFEPDFPKPLAVTFCKARIEWKSLCPEFDQDLARILAINSGDLQYVDRSADGMKWVVGFGSDTECLSYYLYDKITKKTEFLCKANSAFDGYRLAPMTPISFAARDGLTICGYLTCPPGKDPKNLPMVLCPHGGPWTRDYWVFNGTAQWLANRGYACLHVNFRGSRGYGKCFITCSYKEWGGKMQDDLTDAVAWAVNQGIADPKKIAIMGGSYGGYAALCGATLTPDLFCCAVDLCGPANLITFLKSLPEAWGVFQQRMYKMIGNPDTEAEFLKSRSPLSYVDSIKIPLLIVQGANDPRVKQAEAEQIVAALKARGLSYEYLLFADEGHGIVRKENRFTYFAAAEKFLAKRLGGRFEE